MKERGLVSLFTAIFISLLMIIITTAVVAVQIKEQRQATDMDQSIRAYYAAQAGTEDALLKVKDDLASGTVTNTGLTCPAADSEDDLGSTAKVTCKRIISNSQAPEGALNREQSYQIDLHGKPVRQLEIQWNLDGIDAKKPFTDPAPPNKFPNTASWDFPAALEVSAISYPRTSFTPGQVTIETAMLRPVTSGGSSAGALSTISTDNSTHKPTSVGCSQTISAQNRYNCKFTITDIDNLANRYYVFRVRPRYNGTHYKLVFKDSASTVVEIPDQFITIDVTAKAGDIFRRTVTKVPVRSGVASGLDYVIYSDTDICKDFEIDENGIFVPGGFYKDC